MGWNITTAIALGLLFLAGYLALKEHRWLRQAHTTHGSVISLRVSVGRKGGKSFYPRIRFVGRDGQHHEFEGGIGSNPPDFQVGESVPVAYDVASSEGRILTFGQRFGFPASLAVLALALLGLRIVFLAGDYLVPRFYLSAGPRW